MNIPFSSNLKPLITGLIKATFLRDPSDFSYTVINKFPLVINGPNGITGIVNPGVRFYACGAGLPSQMDIATTFYNSTILKTKDKDTIEFLFKETGVNALVVNNRTTVTYAEICIPMNKLSKWKRNIVIVNGNDTLSGTNHALTLEVVPGRNCGDTFVGYVILSIKSARFIDYSLPVLRTHIASWNFERMIYSFGEIHFTKTFDRICRKRGKRKELFQYAYRLRVKEQNDSTNIGLIL